ncbi:Omega-ctenitoxin-Cs1a, partial [Cymbomonas tetramitiformis]
TGSACAQLTVLRDQALELEVLQLNAVGPVLSAASSSNAARSGTGARVLQLNAADQGTERRCFSSMRRDQVESNICRCPDQDAAERMIKAIDDVRTKGDSCGGVVTCVARGVPKGLGAPVFAKLEAELAQAMMSIPATKGFEIGSGFDGAEMTGSTHNDEFYLDDSGAVRTRTNRSGGIQKTVTRGGEETDLRARGRHDPCVVPRAVPMVESMVALVLVDHLLQQHAQCHLFGGNFGGDLSLVAPTISADEAGSSGESKEDLSLAQQAAAYSED